MKTFELPDDTTEKADMIIKIYDISEREFFEEYILQRYHLMESNSEMVRCGECGFRTFHGALKCKINNREINSNQLFVFKPEWCPLNKMP
jgi:hypothetical protein